MSHGIKISHPEPSVAYSRPMILYSESGKATATAHLLQAIVAIPKMKALAENLQAIPYDDKSGRIYSIIWGEADVSHEFHLGDREA